MTSSKKEKRDILFEVSVKNASDGSIQHLKNYIQLEIEWQGNESVSFDKILERGRIVWFMSKKRWNYRFLIKKFKLKKGWFRDKVIDYQLEPIQDEISEKITVAWGYKVSASHQIRWGNVVALTALIFILLLFTAIFFCLRRRKK
ncbi:hypothetical protein [endosymbiont GvMRE of Glomus versiforme]|uniref:hypothetical protein n=1 Tax=endosymbiont GvMRE of Glomus versiforme TaxID=2039283 RepID=UPI000EDBF807|nr:hypothetical protein [endosymbiont GvMRE of Glomus versiforme]RHZ37318.1 hypothetical protein GvMRE_I1g82 [endosymbiont GvMRE of Glomus versiforme]